MEAKVSHGFACINEGSDAEEMRDEDSPTLASQLNNIARFGPEPVVEMKESVLEGDPLHVVLPICQAALKQKSALLLNDAPLDAFESLKEAFKIGLMDVVLVKKLGSLALEVGYVAFARYVLETALCRRPDYVPLREPLMEVCLEVHEYDKALDHARHILESIPEHKRACELLELQDQGHGLLLPKIERRVNWETTPNNHIRKIVTSFQWTALIKAIREVVDGSQRVDTFNASPIDAGGVVIRSVNSDWDVLFGARIVADVAEPRAEDIDMDHGGEAEMLNPNMEMEQERPTRFPLRSRVSGSKKLEEQKGWNVIQMMADVFSSKDWEGLLNDWSAATETQTEEEATAGSSEEFVDISHFLQDVQASEEMTPISLSIAILEHRLKEPSRLKKNEVAELCSLDGLIDFAASPSYCLGMGELLLDASMQLVGTEVSIESTRKEDKAFQRCQRHLFKCLEHKLLLQELDEVEGTNGSFLSDESMARLYWALGKMHLAEGRCTEAETAFETALHHASLLEASLHLSHLQKDICISTETIQAKLSTCFYHDMIDSLLESEVAGDIFQYNHACTLLMPILFPSKKPSVLTTEYRFKGLTYLKQASRDAEAADAEFLCHLSLLDLVMPDLSIDMQQKKDHSAFSTDLPTALETSIECIPSKDVFVQIMEFVTFIFEQLKVHPWSLELAAVLPSLKQLRTDSLLRCVFKKAVHHLEWCFWRFCSQGESSSASKNDSRKRALHEAAALVFILVQLIPVFGSDVEIMGNLALCLFDLLAEREAVCLKKSGRLKHITLHLLAERFATWIEFFYRVEDEDPETLKSFEKLVLETNVEGKEDIQHSIETLIDGLAHFVQCLYGVDLISSQDSDWTSRWSRGVAQGEELNRHELPQLWHYLSPYLSHLESREGDLHVLPKLRILFEKLLDTLEPPPEDLLSALFVSPIFNSSDASIDQSLEKGVLPTVISETIAKRETNVKGIENLSIHEDLYYYYCLSARDEQIDLTSDDGILAPTGLALLEEHIKYVKMDLAFNPDRYWAWECLGISYKDATESFISLCIRDMLPGEYEASEELQERWETLLRSQRRCFLIAWTLAKEQNFEEDRKYVEEMLIELEWLLLTCPPPFLKEEVRSVRPIEDSGLILLPKLGTPEFAASHPEPKWQVLYYVGKKCWKQKKEDWVDASLHYFNEAVKAANRDEGGLIDPLYKLHAARLKLLLMGCDHWDALKTCMFSSQPVDDVTDPQQCLLEDCRAALEFCRVKMSGYHCVHYQLAKAFYQNDNYPGSLSHMQQLFMKGRKKFCITFLPIDPRQCRNSHRSTPNTPGSVKISGSGSEEPVWKFAKRVQKYLALYLKLLFRTGDIDLLSAVTDILAKGDFDGPSQLRTIHAGRYRFPCLVEMPSKAMGLKMLLIHSRIQRELPLEAAICINRDTDTILKHLFNMPITDANYAAVARGLQQILENAFNDMQSMSSFPAAFFSAALETLCEAQCNLQTDVHLRALAVGLSELEDDVIPETAASEILHQISLYGSIFPVLVLKTQNEALASSLAVALQHKALKTGDPTCKDVMRRILFCVIQGLFTKVENIRIHAVTVAGSNTEAPENDIVDAMTHACHLIKYFHDAILESRFLCLRMMHLMGDLYEAMCILHGVGRTVSVQHNLSLKTQSLTLLTAIQDIRQQPKQPIQCIDLTVDDSIPNEDTVQEPIKMEPHRPQCQTPQPPRTESSAADNPTQLPTSAPEIVAEPPPNPSTSSTTPQQGAFFNAFQQFMLRDDNKS